jgi:hypothetical protein
VKVFADEVGGSRETDHEGRFRLVLPPGALQRGVVRLTFSLPGYQPFNTEVQVPAKARV